MNYENGIFIFKGQRRMSSSFIFHSSSFWAQSSNRGFNLYGTDMRPITAFTRVLTYLTARTI
jgi:hypothetical protein